MPEDGYLLVRQGPFDTVLVVAEAIVFLLEVFFIILTIGSIVLRFGPQKGGCEVIEGGLREMRVVESQDFVL